MAFKSKQGNSFSNANMAKVDDARHQQAHPDASAQHGATPPVDPKQRVQHVRHQSSGSEFHAPGAGAHQEVACPACGHSFDASGAQDDSTGFAQ